MHVHDTSIPNIFTQNPSFWHLSWMFEQGATAGTVENEFVVVWSVFGDTIVFSLVSQSFPVKPTLNRKINIKFVILTTP